MLWSIVSAAERCRSAVEQPAPSETRISFEYAGEQFHKNKIYDMQTENLTWDYERGDVTKDDQQLHVLLA